MSATAPLPFWSDDFDMDLLKLFPVLPRALGPVADSPAWTYGGITNGRLNHPSCWNSDLGLISFFWTKKPEHPRDDAGMVNIRGYVTFQPLVECTFLEMVRDAWVHQNVIILDRNVLAQPPREVFAEIMYDLRGWKKSNRAQGMRDKVFDQLLCAGQQFQKIAEKGPDSYE